jgi:solute carrier family 35 protein E3
MKAGNLPCVVILEIILMKTIYRCKTLISILIIVIGLVFSTINELSFDMTGFIAVLLSTVISAIMGIYGARVMKTDIDSFNMARLLGLPSTIFMMILIYFTEINDLSKWIMSEYCNKMNIFLLVISGLIAFMMNLSFFWLKKLFISATVSVVGNFKTV